MHDMLAAFHLVRYFEMRHREQEPYRECIPENRYSVAMRLFRRMRRKG
ncbi:MAG: hypothetical protein JWM58_3947 [Rhizobium sp.]|nr:hypothetical protein [Rhizobium sp.]